ncbi:hypothetical protein GH714_022239 [Hevea brasiliensis]|uniref:Pentatricopeptide repeat-containing protein n=1 Tax=Hevea brasiliensis TaxID=3981 RepID=A0A6A6MV57_HEVBR|nr:hypothetical protein GH714_022239 [Hevea brasiliensis]
MVKDSLRPENDAMVGRIEKSRERFYDISHNGKRSVLLWNSMINAYLQNGFPLDALSLFELMVEDPTCRPNHVTMVCVLSACTQIGDLEPGRWVHEYLKSKGCKAMEAVELFSTMQEFANGLHPNAGTLQPLRIIR